MSSAPTIDVTNYMFDELRRDINVLYLYSVDTFTPDNKRRMLNVMHSLRNMQLYLEKDFDALSKNVSDPMDESLVPRVMTSRVVPQAEDQVVNSNPYMWGAPVPPNGFGKPMSPEHLARVKVIRANFETGDSDLNQELPGFECSPPPPPYSPIITPSRPLSSSKDPSSIFDEWWDEWGLKTCTCDHTNYNESDNSGEYYSYYE
jgi:hypothetical protein